MTVHGMNRWKSAKASEFTTGDGDGQVRTTGEDGNGPIKKISAASQPPADPTAAAMALPSIMYPSGEPADGPIKKSLRVRGSQKLQAVRPDENPGPDENDQNDQNVRAASEPGRPPRRRRRRTTRASARSTP
jgi:hypothetical protein